MPFIIRVVHSPDLLMVEGEGQARLSDMCGLVDAAAEIARRDGYRLGIVNLLATEIGFSFTEHLQLGSHAAARLGEFERVASIVPERYRIGASEKAAQKHGLRLQTFTSLEEGLAWVMGR